MFDSTHYTHDQSYVPHINRPHAVEQWTDRTPADIPLVDAWREAVPVHAPECNAHSTRLYVPYDALLVERAGLLRTVLHNDDRIDVDGLSICPNCNGLYDPVWSSSVCRWCGETLPDRRKTSGVTLVTGGEE